MPPICASNAVSPRTDQLSVHGVSQPPSAWPNWRLPAVLLGAVAGAALQLQQPVLWSTAAYLGLLVMAVVAAVAGVWMRGRARARHRYSASASRWVGIGATALALATGGMALFSVSGLRASAYAASALAAPLEGRDIRVTGVIAAMPQANEAGTRLRLEVEAARLQGEPVQLPALMDVTWYSGAFRDTDDGADMHREAPALRAGERWAMTVRLKAPHGLRNPFGFDYELWMWEQGVQATGSVRTGAKDEAPVRLASTWQHPVEQLRQSVRDAIFARLGRSSDDSDPGRARIAGVVAALVTGDQRAIDRGH